MRDESNLDHFNAIQQLGRMLDLQHLIGSHLAADGEIDHVALLIEQLPEKWLHSLREVQLQSVADERARGDQARRAKQVVVLRDRIQLTALDESAKLLQTACFEFDRSIEYWDKVG